MKFFWRPLPRTYESAISTLADMFRSLQESIGGLVEGRMVPESSADPAENGELVVEATSNTTLTFKLRGTDGTVRSGTITLS